MRAWASDFRKVKHQRRRHKMVSVGQVIIESGVVANSDRITLTGTQQAKILFLSTNPDNSDIKFTYNSASGDMPLTNTRSSGVLGASGVQMDWANVSANGNVNCPLYIDADHFISLSSAGTVNLTWIIYQFTEI